MDLLLVHPPAVKPAEPPLGVALLLAHLRRQGFAAEVIDANLEAYLYLLCPDRLSAAAGHAPPVPLRRGVRHAERSLALLRSPAALDSAERYRTAVLHLQQALGAYRGAGAEEMLTLGDYRHRRLSEFSPAVLADMASGVESTLFADYFRKRLLPQIVAQRPRMIALSVNYRHQVLPAFELAGLLHRELPNVPLIGGGALFSSWAKVLRRLELRLFPFARIVFGPGEEALAALLRGTMGEAYYLQGRPTNNDLPDFSFCRGNTYLSPVPVLPLAASRGCYWQRCLFCPEATAPTHPYACSSPEGFADLLLKMAELYQVKHFHLTDNALPVPVLRALASRTDLGHLSWHGFVRFEHALLEENLLQGLAAAGCRQLQLGLESGSQNVLDRLGKGTRLPEVSRILRKLRQAGIDSYVYVMFGTPGETAEEAAQTLAFLEEHAQEIGFLNTALMNLPRDSAIIAEPDRYGIEHAPLLDDEDVLGLYRSFHGGTGWDRSAARRFVGRLETSPQLRPMLRRIPPLFTSHHAFLFPPPALAAARQSWQHGELYAAGS
jgi:hypothetical protein